MSDQLDLFATESVRAEAFRVHCFFGPCEFVVTEPTPALAHGHMEAHYEMAHRGDLEDLHRRGYIG
jgi:hypothetical protein